MRRRAWIVLACALLGGCDAGDGGGNDDGAGRCEATEPCGGDIVGRWSVEDSCVIETDLSALIGDQPACADIVQSQEIILSGTLAFSAEGEMTASLLNTKNVHIVWSRACLEALSEASVDLPLICERMRVAGPPPAQGASDFVADCRLASDACDCMVTTETPNMATHGYAIEGGDTLVYPGDQRATYCVQGDVLSFVAPIELATSARLTLRRAP
jgi:hypothetical protein